MEVSQEPSRFMGVGTHTNMTSDETTSSGRFGTAQEGSGRLPPDGSLSYVLVSWYGERPNLRAVPTKPCPTIPILFNLNLRLSLRQFYVKFFKSSCSADPFSHRLLFVTSISSSGK